MKKLNVELKSVGVDLVCKTFGLEKEEFNKGSGVYRITTGCRGVIEEVEFSDEYEVLEDSEFYGENGLYIENGIEVFGVGYEEELGVEFVNVIV